MRKELPKKTYETLKKAIEKEAWFESLVHIDRKGMPKYAAAATKDNGTKRVNGYGDTDLLALTDLLQNLTS